MLIPRLMKQHKDDRDAVIEHLFIRTLSRRPTVDELKVLLAEMPESTSEKEMKRYYDGVLWSLLNSSEFLFNH